MAFFQLEPDVMVPIEVTASGYESYHSRIGIASNVTHLVAADLCKKVQCVLAENSKFSKKKKRALSCSSKPETGVINIFKEFSVKTKLVIFF